MINLKAAPAKILLVEDSEDDVDLVKLAIDKAKLIVDLSVVNDGEEALDYLYKKNRYVDATVPDLILLDINMPGMNGLEVLHRVKSDSFLKKIPVIMLTSSSEETDIIRSYDEHANCYLEKPLDFKSFATMIKMFDEFWFSFVTLPTKVQH